MSERSPRVLLLDDEEPICRALDRLLSTAGYEVLTFTRAPEALQELSRANADCLILDLQMPVTDGHAVLRRLAESASTIPVIVLTGGNDGRDLQNSPLVQCCLRKPIEASILFEAVARVCALNRQSTGIGPA